MDLKRISLLCSEAERAQNWVTQFSEQGYRVDVCHDPSTLYQSLCDGRPGFVAISSQVEGAMAATLPDFVIRRFGVPVFLFRERPNENGAPEPDPAALRPEIVPVGDASVSDLLSAMRGFDEVYARRIRESESTPKSAVQMVSGAAGVGANSAKVLASIRMICQKQVVAVQDDDVLMVNICRVKDPSGQGYFVFAFPDRPGESAVDPSIVLESHIRDAVGEAATVERLKQAVSSSFFRGLVARADEVVTGYVGGGEMILLYFKNRPEATEPLTEKIPEQILVPIEEWWTRIPLPCHAYVWLELNHRRVLYVRPGAALRNEGYKRLTSKGIKRMALAPEDYEEYLKIREMVTVSESGSLDGLDRNDARTAVPPRARTEPSQLAAR